MSRPAQVQQMADRAKEIQAEIADVNNENVSDTENEPPNTDADPSKQELPATISKEEYDRLEQRYRTLQGMHSADNARHRGEMDAARNAIAMLEDRLYAIESQTQNAPTAPNKYVTEDDIKEYGDTLDMVRRAAKEEAEAIASQRELTLMQRINDLEGKFGVVQTTVIPRIEEMTVKQQNEVKAGFWAAIDMQVPNWRTINDDPNFKAWLLEEDAITGANRQQFLSHARSNYDALRVIKIFKEWERVTAGGPTPAPNQHAQRELERQVAPPSSRGTAPVQQNEKPIWTKDQINQFYKDSSTGKYAGKLEERKKLEADIFLAQREGRIQN